MNNVNITEKYALCMLKEKIADVLKDLKDTEIAQKIKVAQAAIREMSALVASVMITATTGVH